MVSEKPPDSCCNSRFRVVKSSQSIVCPKVFSPQMNIVFYCTGRMMLCGGAVWCQRCCPSGVMVWAAIDKEHKWILFMAIWIHRNTVMRSEANVVLFINDHHLYNPVFLRSVPYTIPGNQKHTSFSMTGMLTEHVTHGASLESSKFSIYYVCPCSC